MMKSNTFKLTNTGLKSSVKNNKCKGREKPYTENQQQKVIDLYNRGLTYNEMQKATGISQGSLYRILKNNGVIKNKNNKYTDEEKETAVTMLKEGYTLKEVSELTGISTVWLDKLHKKSLDNVSKEVEIQEAIVSNEVKNEPNDPIMFPGEKQKEKIERRGKFMNNNNNVKITIIL